MNRNIPYQTTQKGSALFIILVGVVLFAALSYTVAQMMRGGNPAIITEEKARLYADELLNYARALRQATQNVKINGCPDLSISFEAPNLTGYGHTPAATDGCKIFHEAGGAVNYLVPSQDWLDMIYSPAPLRGEWLFATGACVPGVGNAVAGCQADSVDNEALVALLLFLRKEVCIKVNELLGVPNVNGSPPPITIVGPGTFAKFIGTQSDGSAIDTGGKMAGCYEGNGITTPLSTYHFYQVLLPR